MIILFSSNLDILEEWIQRYNIKEYLSCYDLETLTQALKNHAQDIVVFDYDSISGALNKLISSSNIPQNSVVLEKAPEVTTGKMLISHGIKAYGNSRMQAIHFTQLTAAVNNNKVWTYPELTSALIKNISKPKLSADSIRLIENRLSPKEIETIHYVLDGLTNNAISLKLDITTRTVKAHVSSIFSKLHVSDRISLVLLLK